jgi:glycosyltransferase involved in cell wall biosynthesis
VIFSGNGVLSSPLRKCCGLVTTVNNMLPFTPEQIRSYPTFSWTRIRIALLRHILVRSLSLADVVVLHSQHALDRLTEYYGELPNKSKVVLSGVPTWMQAKIEATSWVPYKGRPYLFYLSAVRVYKNHLNLVEAYRILSQDRKDLPDLLFGGFATEQGYLSLVQDTVIKYGLQDKIKYIGTVEEEQVPSWYRHATINLFSSLCETNSLVISEVLGSGGVLACSSMPPMTEVSGDAAEFFDATNPRSIAEVIGRLLDSPSRRDDLRQRAIRRSDELSWEKCGLVLWDAARRAQLAFAERTGEDLVT